MNLRLRRRRPGEQEIEVAALVGLADMLGKHGAITAQVARRRRAPGGAAAGEFLVGDVQVDAARSASTSISSPVCTKASGPPT